MIKKVLLIVLLFFVEPIFGIIIILNGTGSAGKTSLACALDMLVPGMFEIISFDKVVWRQLISTAQRLGFVSNTMLVEEAKQHIEQLPRSTVDFIWMQSNIDATIVFKQAQERSQEGKNVIIDTIIKNSDA